MQKTLKIRHGMLVFILSLIALGFVGYIVQNAWGMYGFAITEILILLFAIIPAILYKADLKKMFPVKSPNIRHLIGSFMIWMGTYVVVMLVTQMTMYFFPEGFLEVAEHMGGFFSSTPIWISLLIVAVMPAVCEEMLHRGFIHYTLLEKGKWQRIWIMGLVFGIFHLDPYRFLPTSILGMALTFVMIETENILIPMFIHFVNNALAVLFSFGGNEGYVLTQYEILNSIGIFFIIASIVPFLFIFGTKFLQPKPSILHKKRIRLVFIISFSLIVIGSGTLASSVANNDPVFVTNMSLGVDHKSMPHTLTFEVKERGTYNLNLIMQIEDGFGRVYITDSKDLTIFDTTAQELTLTQDIELSPGEYSFILDFLFYEETEDYVNCTVNIRID